MNKWVDEKTAAAMIGYKPETLRKYAKKSKLPIAFTSMNRRKYQYAIKDINKVLNENSTTPQ